MMTARQLINAEEPATVPRIHCDSDAPGFRPDQDLTLSHWIPNQTPAEYKDDTSTAICQRFIENPREGFAEVAINHADTDGTCAAMTLLFPELSREYRQTLEQIATMGDFNAWQPEPVARIYQRLQFLLFTELKGTPEVTRMLRAIHHLKDWLQSPESLHTPEFDSVWQWHSTVQNAIDEKEGLSLEQLDSHLYHILIHSDFQKRHAHIAPATPARFDAGLQQDELLPRQIRNRNAPNALKLISIETAEGWSHELVLPDSVWADTPNLYKPDLNFVDTQANQFELAPSKLNEAIQAWQAQDPGLQRLIHLSPFARGSELGFPVIAANREGGEPVTSRLGLSEVQELFKEVLCD